jgi:hypothetical protein
MKCRSGFVSNSSSSSFVLSIDSIENLKKINVSEEEAFNIAKRDLLYWKDNPSLEEIMESKNNFIKALKQFKEDLDNNFSEINSSNLNEILEFYKNDIYDDGTLLSSFETYQLSSLDNIEHLVSFRMYYIIKKYLDNPKYRKIIFEDLNFIDFEKNKKYFKYYLRTYSKMSSRQFYQDVIRSKLVSQFSGHSYSSWIDRKNERLTPFMKKYLIVFEKEMFAIYSRLYRKLVQEFEKKTFKIIEYSDDTTIGAILESGCFFKTEKHFRISHH